MTVYGDLVSEYARGMGLAFGEHQAIGWVRAGRLEAAAIYHNWHPRTETIEISVAGTRDWITRARVREMFEYPFGFCRKVYGTTRSETLLRAWKHLGGEVYPIPGIYTVVTLTREQWKECRHGRRRT